MCFKWISEQTECVYSTVQTEYLITIEDNLSIYSTKRPVFNPRPVRVRFVVYKVCTGTDFFSEYFGFTLSVSFRQFATLIFIYILL